MAKVETRHEVLSVESDKLLVLPSICVSCGKPTEHKTRVDVGAGDFKTEAVSAVLAFLPFPLPFCRTARIPCCRKCAFLVNLNVVLAFAMLPLGITLVVVAAFPDGIFSGLPEAVRMAICFIGIVGGVGGGLAYNAVAHDRRIPVHVFALSNGRYRYVFYSHIYKAAVEREPESGLWHGRGKAAGGRTE